MTSQSDIIWLSMKVAFLATVLVIPIGTLMGWLFARKQFPGKSLIDGIVSIPLVLPPVVTGYFLLVVFGPDGWIGGFLKTWFGTEIAFTWKAAVLASAVVSMPLFVRAVKVAIENVDPGLEDAARMLRANSRQIFTSITVPLAGNGIIAGAVLAFARSLGEFGATIVFASNIPGQTQTIPLAIFTYLNQPDGESKAKVLVIASIGLAYLSVLVNEWLIVKLRAPNRRLM